MFLFPSAIDLRHLTRAWGLEERWMAWLPEASIPCWTIRSIRLLWWIPHLEGLNLFAKSLSEVGWPVRLDTRTAWRGPWRQRDRQRTRSNTEQRMKLTSKTSTNTEEIKTKDNCDIAYHRPKKEGMKRRREDARVKRPSHLRFIIQNLSLAHQNQSRFSPSATSILTRGVDRLPRDKSSTGDTDAKCKRAQVLSRWQEKQSDWFSSAGLKRWLCWANKTQKSTVKMIP